MPVLSKMLCGACCGYTEPYSFKQTYLENLKQYNEAALQKGIKNKKLIPIGVSLTDEVLYCELDEYQDFTLVDLAVALSDINSKDTSNSEKLNIPSLEQNGSLKYLSAGNNTQRQSSPVHIDDSEDLNVEEALQNNLRSGSYYRVYDHDDNVDELLQVSYTSPDESTPDQQVSSSELDDLVSLNESVLTGTTCISVRNSEEGKDEQIQPETPAVEEKQLLTEELSDVKLPVFENHSNVENDIEIKESTNTRITVTETISGKEAPNPSASEHKDNIDLAKTSDVIHQVNTTSSENIQIQVPQPEMNREDVNNNHMKLNGLDSIANKHRLDHVDANSDKDIEHQQLISHNGNDGTFVTMNGSGIHHDSINQLDISHDLSHDFRELTKFHKNLEDIDSNISSSTYQDSSIIADEHLFDVSDLLNDTTLNAGYGVLQLTIKYDVLGEKLSIMVDNVKDVPKRRNHYSNLQVHIRYLNNMSQKTKAKPYKSPIYNELFEFTIPIDVIASARFRLRLYATEIMRKGIIIGEKMLYMKNISYDKKTHVFALEPPGENRPIRGSFRSLEPIEDEETIKQRAIEDEHSTTISSTQSTMEHGDPELLIGLHYNKQAQLLFVEVIQGMNFIEEKIKAPDCFIRLSLMSPKGEEIGREKTSIKKGRSDPLFRKQFSFNLKESRLNRITLMVCLYYRKAFKRSTMTGWFSMGLNNSSEDCIRHWSLIKSPDTQGEQITRWHKLLHV